MMVGRLLSFWEGNFSGAMLNFRWVPIGLKRPRYCRDHNRNVIPDPHVPWHSVSRADGLRRNVLRSHHEFQGGKGETAGQPTPYKGNQCLDVPAKGRRWINGELGSMGYFQPTFFHGIFWGILTFDPNFLVCFGQGGGGRLISHTEAVEI